MEYSYTVILQAEEEGRYSVFVPALPGCHTEGDTQEEALIMAEDAIRCYIEGLMADNIPIPKETVPAALIQTVKIVA